jgi:hypothetical protein
MGACPRAGSTGEMLMVRNCSTWMATAAALAAASPAAAQINYSVTVGGGPRYYVVEPMPAVVHPMWGRPMYVGRRGYYYYRPAPVYVERPVIVAPQVVTPAQPVVPAKPTPMVQSKPAPIATTISNPKGSTAQKVSQVEAEPVLTPLEPNESTSSKPVPPPPKPMPIVVEDAPAAAASAVPIKFKGELPAGPTSPFVCTHVYTGASLEIQIPAGMTVREIDHGKRSIEIEYEHGEVEIHFHKDGSVTVDYDF